MPALFCLPLPKKTKQVYSIGERKYSASVSLLRIVKKNDQKARIFCFLVAEM
jgi:hypothetical protein